MVLQMYQQTDHTAFPDKCPACGAGVNQQVTADGMLAKYCKRCDWCAKETILVCKNHGKVTEEKELWDGNGRTVIDVCTACGGNV